MSLSVSGIVRVTINLNPLAASVRAFGNLMVAGDSDVISGLERYRTYLSYEGVVADFGVDAPETLAAGLYYEQVPQPATLLIGRWLREDTAASNLGGILSATEQTISLWTVITAGVLSITIDGTVHSLTGLDFSGAANLNAVATIITTALSGAGTCSWNGSYFQVVSGTTGAGAFATGTITLNTNPSYGAKAAATIELTGNPANGNSVVIQGTTVTFVSGTPTGNQVQIGADAAATALALQTFLAASADTNLALMTYGTIGAITTITARLYGVAGNSYTLTKTGANITVSGATFTGGVAADTLTVNGTAITFVALNPSGNQVLVAPTVGQTAANLQEFLSTSTDTNILEGTYATDSTVTTVTAAEAGADGDSFTLTKSSSHISLSGATLSGGAEPSSVSYATTGIAAQLKLTSTLSQGLVPGYDAETPAECAAALALISTNWYGLMFSASVQPTDDENIEVCDFIEPLEVTRVFGATITSTSVLSALITTDLASRMTAAGYKQSFCQYCSTKYYAVASFFGRAFTVDFTAQNTTITLMFKQEPGVTAEDLDQNQATTLQTKRCNVFVTYVNDTTIIQYGVMSGDAFFDEIHGTDWLQNAIQTACYNVLYLSGKVPQTDAGVNQLVNAIAGVCSQAVLNGLVAPGTWSGPEFGTLKNGDFLKTGFYIYAQPIALQAQSDRDLRKSPPIQVAIKLAGAIQSVNILVDVNR